MRLGIIGAGVVGRATARAFIEHVDEVRVYDVVKERSTHPLMSAVPNRAVLDCDLVFVCLPSPQKNDRLECDTSCIENFFSEAVRRADVYPDRVRGVNWVLRSTVPIGTTRRLSEKYDLLNLVHSPEFLTARCAVTDAQLPARNIIGSDLGIKSCDSRTGLNENPVLLSNLYAKRFPGVPIHHLTFEESEAVKLFQNSFFATKIAFWNECRTLADKLGLDWDRVMEAVLADGRISHSHTKVPGPDGHFGFSGSCLPKDLASLVHQLMQHGLTASITQGALWRNVADRERQP